MITREDKLAAAVRHCKECEARFARQKARVEQLEQGGHSDLAAEARERAEFAGGSLAVRPNTIARGKSWYAGFSTKSLPNREAPPRRPHR